MSRAGSGIVGIVMAAAMAVGLCHSADAASSRWLWCEPLHAYYPWARSCPAAWQPVDPYSAERPDRKPATAEGAAKPGAAQPPADPAGAPTFAPQGSLARGDALDAWCRGSTTALNIAMCSDDALRALALQRLQAFDAARARLSPEQLKTLAADQNGWALWYPQNCGLQTAAAPALPLAASVKDCLMQAGRERLQYLRSYGEPAATSVSPPPQAAPTADSAPLPVPNPATTAAAEPQPPSTLPSRAEPAATTAPAPVAQPSKPTASTALPGPRSRRAIPSLIELLQAGTVPAAARLGAMIVAALTVGIWLLAAAYRPRPRRRAASATDGRSEPNFDR